MISKFTLPIILFCFSMFFTTSNACALTREEEDHILVKNAADATHILFHKYRYLSSYLKKARGVLICPTVKESKTIFSLSSSGKCVFLSRDAEGSWSFPAFYKFKQGNPGLSFSSQKRIFLAFAMTQKALESFLDKNLLLRTHSNFSFALVKEDSLLSKTKDFYFAKFSDKPIENFQISNSQISEDSAAALAYYHRPVEAIDILFAMKVFRQEANTLRREILKASL